MMQIKNWFTGDVIFTSHAAKTAREALTDAKNNGIDISRGSVYVTTIGSVYVTTMAVAKPAKNAEAEERTIQKKYYKIDKDEIIKKILVFFKGENQTKELGVDGDRLAHNPFYVLFKCFREKELLAMSEIELQNSLKLARFTFCMTAEDCWDWD